MEVAGSLDTRNFRLPSPCTWCLLSSTRDMQRGLAVVTDVSAKHNGWPSGVKPLKHGPMPRSVPPPLSKCSKFVQITTAASLHWLTYILNNNGIILDLTPLMFWRLTHNFVSKHIPTQVQKQCAKPSNSTYPPSTQLGCVKRVGISTAVLTIRMRHTRPPPPPS
jgi:hypothetical protein